jgi:hypothetical protein
MWANNEQRVGGTGIEGNTDEKVAEEKAGAMNGVEKKIMDEKKIRW